MSTAPNLTSTAVAPIGDMTPWVATVTSRKEEIDGVVTLDMQLPQGRGMEFAPGQFTMLTAFGVGEIPVSISGDAAQPETLVHTIRDVGAVSHALVEMQPGAQLGVRGPFGVGWPVHEAKDRNVLIIAGGLGLAPLRPAIYHVLNNRSDYGEVAIVYGARSPAEILYPDELEQWRKRGEAQVSVTVDSAGLEWTGHVGVVTQRIPELVQSPDNSIAMVCGPEIMMRFSASTLNEAGLRDEDIYLSMERNMKCAIKLCGHCQLGPHFICQDGPVFSNDHLKAFMTIKEL